MRILCTYKVWMYLFNSTIPRLSWDYAIWSFYQRSRTPDRSETQKMHGLWHKTHLHMRSRSLPIMTSSNKGGRYTILGLHWKKRPGRSYCISWLCKYMVSRGPQHCSYHLAHTVHNQLIRVFAHQYTVQLSSRHSLNRGIYSVISSNPSLTALSSPFAPEPPDLRRTV